MHKKPNPQPVTDPGPGPMPGAIYRPVRLCGHGDGQNLAESKMREMVEPGILRSRGVETYRPKFPALRGV